MVALMERDLVASRIHHPHNYQMQHLVKKNVQSLLMHSYDTSTSLFNVIT